MNIHETDGSTFDPMGQALNVLGALLSIDPADRDLDPVLLHFLAPDLSASWPLLSTRLVKSLQERIIETMKSDPSGGGVPSPAWRRSLHVAFCDLFVGPAPLAAPPWGSVYLEEEATLYGVSTMELKSFLSAHGISATSPDGGPEDHFGTLCLIAAWLTSQGRLDLLNELLGEHILPWAFAYLEALRQASLDIARDNPTAAFYSSTAELAAATLHALQEERAISVTKKRLHHPQAVQ